MSSDSLPESARQNIRAVRDLQTAAQRRRTRAERLTDAVSRFAGSFPFLICQVVVILVWAGVNLALEPSERAFDAYPFELLTLLLDIEAILLSTFVLMTQDRQSDEAEQRGHMQLQVALMAERESTKVLQMLQAICTRLGLEQVAADPELAQMVRTTPIEELAREMERVRNEPAGAAPPAGGERAPEPPPAS